MHCRPMTAPFRIRAPMPISASSSTVQPWRMAWWPTVTRAPMSQRRARIGMADRAVLEIALVAEKIGVLSARMTAPNQTLQRFPKRTSPIRSAEGATQAARP